jgi:hypothetical protein
MAMEILFAFAVVYIAWRIAVGVLRALGDILRMLTWPLLWLANRQALQAQRRQ